MQKFFGSFFQKRTCFLVRLIAIGRLRASPERALFDQYCQRLRPKLELTELAEARGTPAEIKRREGEAILAALAPGSRLVALDLGGPAPSSEVLAKQLEGWLDGRLAFVIGGAEGLDAAVLARADHVLSLGPLTWPHMLVRVMLAEQLYRARCIATGHPYHRGGRP